MSDLFDLFDIWPPFGGGAAVDTPTVPQPPPCPRGNLLRSGLAWLTRQVRDNLSEVVTYARGTDSVDVRAAIGKKLLKLDTGDGGVVIEWTDLDLLIPACELRLDGRRVTPLRGDTVYVVAGDAVQVYEVLPYGGEPVWRWADPFQTMIRVHAKHVDSEERLIP